MEVVVREYRWGLNCADHGNELAQCLIRAMQLKPLTLHIHTYINVISKKNTTSCVMQFLFQ